MPETAVHSEIHKSSCAKFYITAVLSCLNDQFVQHIAATHLMWSTAQHYCYRLFPRPILLKAHSCTTHLYLEQFASTSRRFCCVAVNMTLADIGKHFSNSWHRPAW